MTFEDWARKQARAEIAAILRRIIEALEAGNKVAADGLDAVNETMRDSMCDAVSGPPMLIDIENALTGIIADIRAAYAKEGPTAAYFEDIGSLIGLIKSFERSPFFGGDGLIRGSQPRDE